jgi:two-component system KDP operon response regulator KdpE
MRISLQRILAVDDELQMRRVLRASPSAQGYQVVEAESGEGALSRLSTERCDFILLDLNLPGLDGIGTCRAIRADSDAPIIVVSIGTSEKNTVAAREAGANDYITKPFGIEELLSRIREVSRSKPGFRS